MYGRLCVEIMDPGPDDYIETDPSVTRSTSFTICARMASDSPIPNEISQNHDTLNGHTVHVLPPNDDGGYMRSHIISHRRFLLNKKVINIHVWDDDNDASTALFASKEPKYINFVDKVKVTFRSHFCFSPTSTNKPTGICQVTVWNKTPNGFEPFIYRNTSWAADVEVDIELPPVGLLDQAFSTAHAIDNNNLFHIQHSAITPPTPPAGDDELPSYDESMNASSQVSNAHLQSGSVRYSRLKEYEELNLTT